MTVRISICYLLLKSRNKSLEVILFGGVGCYFWGDENGFNGGEGFRNSGVGLVW